MHCTRLRCLRCDATYPVRFDAYLCPRCGPGDSGSDPGILDVEYDEPAVARAWERRDPALRGRNDVFRYLPLLPLESPEELLPAGGTPLLPAPRLAARLGLGTLYVKDETRNPTRCLKDRATAVAVALAAAAGKSDLYCASPGNAAISLAGFCAHRGLACHVFVPRDASPERLAWLERFGADVKLCEGSYDQAYSEAEQAGRENGWYSRNCAFNPYLVEGKKTAALEIAEQLAGRLPDLVVSPVGDGCTLAALGKGFREAVRIGLADRMPRLLGVQSDAVQPLVKRFAGESPSESGRTRAVSIRVQRPRNAIRLLREIEASRGTMVAVSDEAIEAAREQLSAEAGVVAEFTGAAALAGLAALARREPLAGASAVVVVTGGREEA